LSESLAGPKRAASRRMSPTPSTMAYPPVSNQISLLALAPACGSIRRVKPLILNGIEDVAKRPDLADRAVIFNLTYNPRSNRAARWQDLQTGRRVLHHKGTGI
jgi:hypothetical protein